MDVQSILVLIAELGIGIAGFAAVAVAVASQKSVQHSSLHVAQVNTMMFGSLGVVFMALLPMLIALAAPGSSFIWLVPSLLYAIAHLSFAIQLLRRMPTWRHQPGFSMQHTIFAFSALSMPIGLNTYNLLFAGTSWPYLASLACGLAVPSSRFIQIVGSLWQQESASD